MSNKNFKRHGDVPMLRITKKLAMELIAKQAPMQRESGNIVLAYGETSGHAHVITESSVEAFPTRLGDVVICPIETGFDLKHIDAGGALTGEHSTIHFDQGYYLRLRQREYTLQGNRDVID